MREKHWSPDMLTRVDPTAWLPSVTLAGTMVRGLPGQCTGCSSWLCSQEKEKCCNQRHESERKEVPCSSFASQGPKRKAEDSMDLEAPALLRREKSHTGPLGCTSMGTKGEGETGCKNTNTDINRQ